MKVLVAQSCLTLCDPMDCSTPGLLVHHNSLSLLKLMSIESVTPSNHLLLCCPLLLLPPVSPSIRVFSNKSVPHSRWPDDWSFSFSISTSNGYSGLISFRLDWLDLLAVQGVLESSPTPQFESISSRRSTTTTIITVKTPSLPSSSLGTTAGAPHFTSPTY